MITLIPASELVEGDTIPGLDNAYVVEVEEGNGYLSYPRTGYGMGVAMPDDTLVVTYHDAEGRECFILLPSESMLTVDR